MKTDTIDSLFGEPGLDELLDGEPCRLLMARDGLSREEVLQEFCAAADRLKQADLTALRRLAA